MKHYPRYKGFIACLIFVATPLFFIAQSALDLTTLQSIKKEKDLPLAYYQIACIYADSLSTYFNLDSAYYYILEAETAMKTLSEKERDNVKEKTKPSFSALRTNIVQQAFRQVQKAGTLAAYDHFLNYYKKAEAPLQAKAALARDQLALEYAKSSDTYAVYSEVWKKYGSSLQARTPTAFLQLEKDLFDVFLKERSWSAFAQFAADHPQHLYVKSGWKERFEQMRTATNPVVVEQFIASAANMPFLAIAIDSLASKLIRLGDLPACERFVKRYPTHPQVNQVWKACYETFKRKYPSQVALVKFKTEHPNFPYPDQIDADLKALASAFYTSVLQSDDSQKHYQFIQLNTKHPKVDSVWLHLFKIEQAKNPGMAGLEKFRQEYLDFPFPKKIEEAKAAAINYDYRAALKSKDKQACIAFIEKYPTYPKVKIDSVWMRIFTLYETQASTVEDWKRFQQEYPKFPFSDRVKNAIEKTIRATEEKDFQALKTGSSLENYWNFLDRYQDSPHKKEVQAQIDQFVLSSNNIAEIETYLGRYPTTPNYMVLLDRLYNLYKKQQGLTGIETFERKYPKFHNSQILQKDKKDYQSDRYKIFSISDKINTSKGEFSPIISSDGNTLFFCGKDRDDNIGQEDIFMSEKVDGEWQKPIVLKDICSSYDNESPKSVSADGTELIFFKAGYIYSSKKNDTGWSTPILLSSAINRGAWQSDAQITSNGKAMFFAARREEGADVDIYIALRAKDDSWETAKPLKAPINSNADDRSPFLHPDLETLYFSSRRSGGKGGYDVYLSKRLDKEDWFTWSEPVNLGDTLNTSGEDWGFKVTTDAKMAYFSREKIYEDIYMTYLPESYQAAEVTTIAGRVQDEKGNPVETDIIWQNLQTLDTIQITRNNPNGTFFATLPPMQGLIGYSINQKGYFPSAGNIDLRDGKEKNIQLEEPIVLMLIEKARDEGITLPINNLFFETAKYEILAESFVELDRWVTIIQNNDLRIEIHGHTDNVGASTDNKALSQNRANKVREYLMKKGCKENQLTAIGFGEAKPIATNETEEGKAKNRRVEIRIK